MQKEGLEIRLNGKIDAFDVEAYMNRFKEISKCHSVDCSTIRVYYNAEKIVAKKVLKLVQTYGSEPGGRRRKKNVVSVIEITNKTAK